MIYSKAPVKGIISALCKKLGYEVILKDCNEVKLKKARKNEAPMP